MVSIEENPTHTYEKAGTYKVELSVYNEEGQVVKKTDTIIVSPPIVVMAAPIIVDQEEVAKTNALPMVGLGFLLMFLIFTKKREKM